MVLVANMKIIKFFLIVSLVIKLIASFNFIASAEQEEMVLSKKHEPVSVSVPKEIVLETKMVQCVYELGDATDHCIKILMENKFEKSVCIPERLLPVSTDFVPHSFSVYNTKGGGVESKFDMEQLLPLSSLSLGGKYAPLVRYIYPGSKLELDYRLNDFYSLKEGKEYVFELYLHAYYCDSLSVNKAPEYMILTAQTSN